MNEQIKELYTKAYCMAFDEADDKNFLDHHMEKFAELLLEECCQICIDKWVEKTSEDARDCYVAIQEHFKIGPKYEREN